MNVGGEAETGLAWSQPAEEVALASIFYPAIHREQLRNK